MKRHIELLLAAVALSASGVAHWRWRHAVPRPAAPAPVATALVTLPAPFDPDSLDDAVAMLAGADPFRLANTPPAVRFQARPAMAAGVPAVQPTRPALVLRAIVGGPPWQAVLDGLPQQPGGGGTVVAPGSRVGQLRVVSVTRDTVVVQGADTIWRLTLKPNAP